MAYDRDGEHLPNRNPRSYTVTRNYELSCAHHLPMMPEGHKCRRPHGHNYRIEITVAGKPDPEKGLFIDFYDLDEIVRACIIDPIDHRNLNEIPGLEDPTTERLCLWVWQHLALHLPGLHRIRVSEDRFSSVELSE